MKDTPLVRVKKTKFLVLVGLGSFYLFIYLFLFQLCHARSQFPKWGWNPRLLQWKCGVLTTREVPEVQLYKKSMKSESVCCSVMFDSLDPLDYSPPGSSAQGILQARILDWVVIPFSRGSFQSRDQTRASHTVGRSFTI